MQLVGNDPDPGQLCRMLSRIHSYADVFAAELQHQPRIGNCHAYIGEKACLAAAFEKACAPFSFAAHCDKAVVLELAQVDRRLTRKRMLRAEHKIEIHVMCVLYFKLFAVYRRNAEAYVYIAAYQRFIDLGVRVFFDGDI